MALVTLTGAHRRFDGQSSAENLNVVADLFREPIISHFDYV